MKLYIQILLISLIFGQISFAQNQQKGVLQGKVLFKNGAPVTMATVFIKGTSLYASTDEQGFFKISHLPIGKRYDIRVKPFGKEEVSLKVYFEKSHQEINVKLDSNEDISLGEVVVSGKNKAQQTREKGFAMDVINTKEASFQNLQTTELLNRSAGVKIRQTGGMGSDINLNINGLTGNSLRVFVDGIPVRNFGRSFSIGSIPPSLIERIEVYKGVLPSELSEDALGGGINIVLKKDVTNNLSTSYSLGSFNTHQWDLNASYRDKTSGFVANLSSYHNYTDNNYKVWGDNVYISDPETGKLKYITATRFHDTYFASGIRGNIGFVQKKWADELLFGFMFSKMEKDIQTGATMHRVYGSRETQSDSQLASIQYKKDNLFFKGLDFSMFTTHSLTYRNITDTDNRVFNWLGEVIKDYKGDDLLSPPGQGEAGNATMAENTERNLSNRTHLHYHLNENHTLALNYFYDGFTRKIDDPLLPTLVRNALDTRKYRKQIIAANYESAFFDKRLKTNIFYKIYNQKVALTEVRYARHPTAGYTIQTRVHDRTIDHKGYGLTLSYALFPKIVLVTSAEKAYRLPGITELLGNTSEMVNANYTLLPEHSNNLNIGFNLGEFNYKRHSLSAETNFFVRDIHDLIIQNVPRETDNSFTYTNLGKVISKGIDFELRYNWAKKLSLISNFSYNEARFNLEFDPFGVRYFYYRSRLRNQPYLTSNTNVEYVFDNIFQKKSRLTVNYNFGYTHQFYLNWENLGSANKITIPAQPLHDVALTYVFPNRKVTLSFNAKNLFDTQVFDNFALQKPGRAFYGKLTYSLFGR